MYLLQKLTAYATMLATVTVWGIGMKKILSLIVLLALIFLFVGCNSDPLNDISNYTIDYNDAESFESALNDGLKGKGKVVQFCVKEYVSESVLGINCHAGEHLNFLFDEELEVSAGDTIVVRVTEQPSKLFLFGSWKIPCELIRFIERAEFETSTNNGEDSGGNAEIESPTVSDNETEQIVEAAELAFLDDFTEYGYSAEQIAAMRTILVNVGITEISDLEIGNVSYGMQVIKGLAYKDRSFMADANDEVQVQFNIENGAIYLVAIYCPSYYSENQTPYLSGLEDRRADLYYDYEGGYIKKIDWENKAVVDYE